MAILLYWISRSYSEMIKYTIQFELNPDKLNEFKLSWESFYEHAKGTDGLSTCKINHLGNTQHKIVMIWEDQFYLNLFKKGDWHNFLLGAISVLGDKSIFTQRNLET